MKSVLCVYDLSTETSRILLTHEGRIEAPNWSPDGARLLVNGEGRLFEVPLDDPKLVMLDTGEATRCNNDHGYSPDGRWILLSSHHEDRGSLIYRVPARGGKPERLTPEAPSWWHGVSPDGKTITFPAARGGTRILDIYTRDLASGQETRLTGGEGHHDGSDYSHDGRHIYYNTDRDGHAQIWVMTSEGRDHRRLFADDHVNWFPHPSPDGQHLLYLAFPPGTEGHPADLAVALVLCRPDGGDRRRIVEFTGGQGSINVPCWAPDGHAFAYMTYQP